MTEAAQTPATSRRTLLCCGAAVLAGGTALTVAGCSGNSTAKSSSSADNAVEVGAVADVPVGGGKIYSDQKIVVTQPTAGQYKAFSATCTHAGCTVGQVKNGLIMCPCHGSQFKIEDGSVVAGPAPESLPSYQVTVQNGKFEVTES
ncbi:Rieske (2Fe-2S) protein [Kitasatospora sp. NPDC052896]|uniref:Rieske (2Fe-2S) protein n=1 Tax=Kitasatospora sp. NPDC052896 TaxID=3364061 RepID=UPI0037C64D74